MQPAHRLGSPPRCFQLKDTIQANKHPHEIACCRKTTFRGCFDYRGRHSGSRRSFLGWLLAQLLLTLPGRQRRGPVALCPPGTHGPGCRAAMPPPRAVTQPMFLGFDPFDVPPTPGMQAAVWGKKQQNRASCHPYIATPQQGLPSPHLQRATRVLPSHPAFISLIILPTSKQGAGARCWRFNCIPDLMLCRHPSPPESLLGRGLGGCFVGFFPPISTL